MINHENGTFRQMPFKSLVMMILLGLTHIACFYPQSYKVPHHAHSLINVEQHFLPSAFILWGEDFEPQEPVAQVFFPAHQEVNGPFQKLFSLKIHVLETEQLISFYNEKFSPYLQVIPPPT